MRHSIRARLVGSYVLLALLTVAAAGLVAQSLVAREVARRQAATLRSNAEAIAAEALPFLWPAPRDVALAELARSASFLLDARVEIESAEGETVADSGAVGEAQAFLLFDDPAIDARKLSHLSALLESHGPEHEVPAWIGDPNVSVVEGEAPAYRVFIRREGGPWGGMLSFDWLADGATIDAVSAMPPESLTLREGDLTVELEGEAPVVRVEAMEIVGDVEVVEHMAGSAKAAAIRLTPSQQERRPHMIVDQLRFVGRRGDGPEAGAGHVGGLHGAFVARSAEPVEVAPVVASIGDPAAPLGRVRISEGTDLRPAALAATRHAFSIAAFVAALMAAGAGLVVARGMSAPLSALAETAGRMAEGDLSARAAPHGEDEIGRLSRQFNHMADGLQESFDALAAERDALRRFIADASHELRTPITALRNFNELLLGPAEDDPEARAEFLAESTAQLDRLEWITGHLLDLSRLEAGLVTMEREPVTADDLLAAAAAPFRPAAESRDITLSLDVAPGLQTMHVDRGRLILAVSNLVDNAMRHAPDGGHVRLGADASADPGAVSEALEGETGVVPSVRLWVEDDGPGVPDHERERIFDRFYRGADAAPGGSGLGLAIVDGIVRAHGGTSDVTSAEGGGARFELRLPVG